MLAGVRQGGGADRPRPPPRARARRYKHKYLAAALCNFQAEYAGGKLRTRISIDKAGIMSIQHLVNITEQASDMLHMQGANKLSMHVKFCILPEEEDLDDDGP